ncbi:MAG TPA: hypothetical protein VKE41_09080 [Roseiflexaceae bacterium]|nr:hypothetical protein [Roseiflexaceae bacterium]
MNADKSQLSGVVRGHQGCALEERAIQQQFIFFRTYAVGVLAGVRGPAAPEKLLFRPPVAALPPRVGGKRSSLEGFALQTSQLRYFYSLFARRAKKENKKKEKYR